MTTDQSVPRFVCLCGSDRFRCTAVVSGTAEAVVQTMEDGGLDEVELDAFGAELEPEDYDGPFTCDSCGRQYDALPPEGWTGWDASNTTLTPRERRKLGEQPLLPGLMEVAG